jgi:hypothetical protein
MGFCLHWWKLLSGINNWGTRRCRWCGKKELAMYNKETSSVEWVIVNADV